MLIQPGLKLLLEDVDHINITFLLLLLTYNLTQISKLLDKDPSLQSERYEWKKKTDFISSPH